MLISAQVLRGSGRIDEESYKIFTHVFSAFAGIAVAAFIAWRCQSFREPSRARRWAVTLVLLFIIAQGAIGGLRVERVSLWLATLIPAYDPVVTMLGLVVLLVTGLVLGSIRFKIAARHATEESPLPQLAGSRRPRLRRSFPYLGS